MLTLLARAKINLTLDIFGKREDGYHDLSSVMQSIELYDCLRIAPAKELNLQLETRNGVMPWLPTDERNDVLRAAMLLKQRYKVQQGASLRLTKFIPIQAGLGGGSADSAATLVGLNRFWQLGLPPKEIRQLAAELGSDIVFTLTGGTAICQGRGEIVTPLPKIKPRWLTLFKPMRGLSTARVFQSLDLSQLPKPKTRDLIVCLHNSSSREDPWKHMGNHLMNAAFGLSDELRDFGALLDQKGYRWQMSGSGPTVFVLADDKEHADSIRSLTPEGWWSFATRTSTRGVETIRKD